jgi:hypothetical protein
MPIISTFFGIVIRRLAQSEALRSSVPTLPEDPKTPFCATRLKKQKHP